MSLMTIRLELGRTREFPQGDARHGYEFVAPLDPDGHLDPVTWKRQKDCCLVQSFRPGSELRRGKLRHVGQGWRFDYVAGIEDDEPLFKLERHVIAPGLYLTVKEEDGEERPFKIVSVRPAGNGA
jgi:hypothetical protein